MSAELLRRAAKMLRERAEGASPAPWAHVDYHDYSGDESTFMGCGSIISMHPDTMGGDIAAPNGDCYPRGGYSPFEDMQYIALMHPPVALALAKALDSTAAAYDDVSPPLADEVFADEVVLARTILREVSS